MRRLLLVLFVASLAAPADAGVLFWKKKPKPKPEPHSFYMLDRMQIPVRIASADGGVRYASVNAPRMLPLLQAYPLGSGGSVSQGVAFPGGTDTQVCYNKTGTLVCGDSGFVYNDSTDTATAVVVATVTAFRAPDGTAAIPSVSFTSETGSGMWRTSNGVNFSVAQGFHWRLDGAGSIAELQIGSGTQFSWSSTDPPTGTDGDTGFSRLAAGVIRPTNGSTAAGGWIQGGGDVALNANYTNATTTFSATALSVTLVSGRTYSFSMALLLTESTAADGVKIDFNGGAATMTLFGASCVLTNDTGAIVAQANAITAALGTVINATATVTTAQHLYRCDGVIVPSSSSTFIVRAAQNAHSTGTLTILRGSWLSVRDANPL